MTDDQPCSGFPDQCPNQRTVQPNWPVHGGGIRCGCADPTPSIGIVSPVDMEGVTITAAKVQDSVISISASNGRPLVAIRRDGRLEFGDDYQPDAAARLFWEAVQRFAPIQMEQQFGRPLAERINAELGALQRVREWTSSKPVTARNEFGDGYREALRDVRDLLPKED